MEVVQTSKDVGVKAPQTERMRQASYISTRLKKKKIIVQSFCQYIPK